MQKCDGSKWCAEEVSAVDFLYNSLFSIFKYASTFYYFVVFIICRMFDLFVLCIIV